MNEPATKVGAARDVAQRLLHDRRAARLVALLVAGAIVSLLVSRHLGPDANWDLLNYHYYNGRALITGSFTDDVAPGGLQSYLNPFVDVPIYLFTEILGPARGLMAWTGLVQFVCYIALWRLTGAFPRVRDMLALRIAGFALAATGSVAMSVAFTTFGDWVTAALICESTTQMMRWARERDSRSLILSGLVMGVAVSIKYTAGVYLVAALVATAIAFGARASARWLAAAIAGVGLVAGPWMVYLLARFGSPMFPLYNQIFRADAGPARNIDDARYGAHSILDLLTFPVDIARASTTFSELAFAEWRWIGLLATTALVLATVDRSRLVRWAGTPIIRWWVCLGLVVYPLWIVVFGYYRYFVFAELATSLAIVALLATVVGSDSRLVWVVSLGMLVLVPAQTVPNWGRGDALYQPTLAALVDEHQIRPQHVLFVGPPPFGYLTASFPSSTRFGATFSFASGELRYAGELKTDLDALVATGETDASLFVIRDVGNLDLPEPAARLEATDCRPFESIGRQLEYCRLVRP